MYSNNGTNRLMHSKLCITCFSIHGSRFKEMQIYMFSLINLASCTFCYSAVSWVKLKNEKYCLPIIKTRLAYHAI